MPRSWKSRAIFLPTPGPHRAGNGNTLPFTHKVKIFCHYLNSVILGDYRPILLSLRNGRDAEADKWRRYFYIHKTTNNEIVGKSEIE